MSGKPNRNSPLLRLPSELRLLIFEHVMRLEAPGGSIVPLDGLVPCNCEMSQLWSSKAAGLKPRRRRRVAGLVKRTFLRWLMGVNRHIEVDLFWTRPPCNLRSFGHRINPSFLQINDQLRSEALDALYRLNILTISSQAALDMLTQKSIVAMLRRVVIQELNPDRSIFTAPDHRQGARILHDIVTAPLLKSLVIDIEPFFSDHSRPRYTNVPHPAAVRRAIKVFGLSSTVESRCTSIGKYSLHHLSSDIPDAVEPSITCRGDSLWQLRLDDFDALALPPRLLQKVTLEHRAVVSQWQLAQKFDVLDLDEREWLVARRGFSRMQESLMHLTGLASGGAHPSKCQIMFWRSHEFLAGVYWGQKKKLELVIDATTAVEAKREHDRIMRQCLQYLHAYAHGWADDFWWEDAIYPEEMSLISKTSGVGPGFDAGKLMPGQDERLLNMWTVIFAGFVWLIRRGWWRFG